MNATKLDLDPARNPGVLDTLTWDPEAAVRQVTGFRDQLKEIERAAISSSSIDHFRANLARVDGGELKLFPDSLVLDGGTGYILAALPDGQRLFLSASVTGAKPALETIGEVCMGWVSAYICPVNLKSVAKLTGEIAGKFGPTALGAVPRLGIGSRQTVTVWPGVFQALTQIGAPAEAIQNSAYRELAPMDAILSPPSSEAAYLPGHGGLSIGHTGASIEGLWLSGVVCAMEHGFSQPYGADLDHVPVKSLDEEGLARAKRLIDLGRHYTFFTLDTSPLAKFDAPDPAERYGPAVEAGTEIYQHIKALKGEAPFDFEFSLDEGRRITTPAELEFVLRGLASGGVNVNFVAPNVGFEKRADYRLPDGLMALEERARALSQVAARYGALLDFHSGSDKSPETYRTISRACDGRLKLKVSGRLQLILAEVLADTDPDFFEFWWDWTLEAARTEADRGSEVAARCVRMLDKRRAEEGTSFRRSPKDPFFMDFAFAMVGAKDEAGRFLFRERFYDLRPDVQAEYTRRVKDYLVSLAEHLGLAREPRQAQGELSRDPE